MTIEEVQRQSRELAKDIQAKIQKFHDDTGLLLELSVDTIDVTLLSDDSCKRVYQVSITTSLISRS